MILTVVVIDEILDQKKVLSRNIFQSDSFKVPIKNCSIEYEHNGNIVMCHLKMWNLSRLEKRKKIPTKRKNEENEFVSNVLSAHSFPTYC